MADPARRKGCVQPQRRGRVAPLGHLGLEGRRLDFHNGRAVDARGNRRAAKGLERVARGFRKPSRENLSTRGSLPALAGGH
jgi:hypothetical protein